MEGDISPDLNMIGLLCALHLLGLRWLRWFVTESWGSKLVYSKTGDKMQEETVLGMDSRYISENVCIYVVVHS